MFIFLVLPKQKETDIYLYCPANTKPLENHVFCQCNRVVVEIGQSIQSVETAGKCVM